MKIHTLVIRSSAGLLLITLTGQGQARTVSDEVDRYVPARMRDGHIPGASVAVVRRGRIVKAAGYGLANLELGLSASPNSIYELASMTKQFTATAIMMLAGEHRLSLDDPISKYLPEVPKTWHGVTIRRLLNHTSGIASHTELPIILSDESRDYSRAQMLAIITEAPVTFPPGEQWAYNDTGYFLLGMVVEKASGQPYGRFMRERIFQPLGMSSSRENVIDDVILNRVSGYVFRNGALRRGRPVSPTQSFGGGHLMSTVLDLAKWERALAGDELLPPSALDSMWTPARLDDGQTVAVSFPDHLERLADFQGLSTYGFGWFLGEFRGHPIVEHAGIISSGFRTDILRFPDDSLTVIVLINCVPVDFFARDAIGPGAIARGVAALYLPDLR